MDFDALRARATKVLSEGKEVALNVVSVGGHHKLQQARIDNDARRQDYDSSVISYKCAKEALQNSYSALEGPAAESAQLIKDARRFVERLSWSKISSNVASIAAFQMPPLTEVDRVLSEINVASEAGKGAGIGAATGAAAWLLVAQFGTASTGTAIGGLSGAAATNAVLAWFGGGSLAAGGGGMLLGGAVFGSAIALPAIAFIAYQSYKKISRLQSETARISDAVRKNNESSEAMLELAPRVDSLRIWVVEQNRVFTDRLCLFRGRARMLAEEIACVANQFAAELSSRNETLSDD